MKLTEQKLREIIQSEIKSLNEGTNIKKAFKILSKAFSDIEIVDGSIEITDENPWGDDNEYTFYYDGQLLQSGSEVSSRFWSEIVSPEEVIKIVQNGDAPGKGEWD